MVMQSSRRTSSSRLRFRLRSTSSRTLAFKVSHHKADTSWTPPAKDGDDDAPPAPQKKRR
jgi:hypothetical protein